MMLRMLLLGSVVACVCAVYPLRVFYGDRSQNEIMSITLDGEEAVPIVTADVGSVHQLVIDDRDPDNALLYWTDSRNGELRRAPVDGSQPAQTVMSNLLRPTSLRIWRAADATYLYVAESQDVGTLGREGGLSRIRLPPVDQVFDVAGLVKEPVIASSDLGPSVDPTRNYAVGAFDIANTPWTNETQLMWVQQGLYQDSSLVVSNLDGGNVFRIIDNMEIPPWTIIGIPPSVVYAPRDVRYASPYLYIADRREVWRLHLDPLLRHRNATSITNDNLASRPDGQWELVSQCSTAFYQMAVDPVSRDLLWTEGFAAQRVVRVPGGLASNTTRTPIASTGLGSSPAGISIAAVRVVAPEQSSLIDTLVIGIAVVGGAVVVVALAGLLKGKRPIYLVLIDSSTEMADVLDNLDIEDPDEDEVAIGKVGGVTAVVMRIPHYLGAQAASLAVARAVQDFKPAAMISVGRCHAFDRQHTGLGDVIISSSLFVAEQDAGLQHSNNSADDNRRSLPAGAVSMFPTLAASPSEASLSSGSTPRDVFVAFTLRKAWLQGWRSAADKWKQSAKVDFGGFVSGPIMPQADAMVRRQQLGAPAAAAGDMFSGLVAGVADSLHINLVVVRSVARFADGATDPMLDPEDSDRLASRNAAAFLRHAFTVRT